mmetsp:Transcript_20310/g.48366  ORF Transcript_20310/g.48366 Transcript_20310/m.48366 type:complete len:659 (-) Transcript_20310:149-2125(-)
MGSARKLQTEIDRTLKKVQEGVELFDSIWQKVYDTDNANQKEKYEADLKKEIKKLQRQRDQIRTWIASNDIKDKMPLIEARKQIEREMERFKICERETKTKAYSKEGLGQAAKVDPTERFKIEMREWLTNTVETLSTQIDQFEYEMDGLTLGKKNKPPPRLTHLEESIRRHKEHIRRLEQMLRLFDNETITPEDVYDMKELIDDYVERNQDGFEEFGNPDDLYDVLIDQLDKATILDPVSAPPLVPEKKEKEKKSDKEKEKEKEKESEKEAERKRERERQAAAALKNQARGLPTTPSKEDSVQEKPFLRQSSAPASSQAAQQSGKEQHASKAAAAAAPAAPAAPAASPQPTGKATPPRAMTPSSRSEAPAGISEPATAAGVAADLEPAEPVRSAAEAKPEAKAAQDPNSMAESAQDPAGKAPAPEPSPQRLPTPSQGLGAAASASAPQQAVDESGLPSGAPAARLEPSPFGPSDGRAMAGGHEDAAAAPAFPGLGVGTPQGFHSAIANQQLLQNCASRSIPMPGDARWNTYSRPRIPQNLAMPPSYPAAKMPIFDNPALFEKLDTEALFFAFYHQPGTYQQYLAARELKRQSWRYHKVHGAWFQRHEEPTVITDDYEQGTYVYFDYNIMHDDLQQGWCYRLKQDFTFEYESLEDELAV